jgi:hypothetical protein
MSPKQHTAAHRRRACGLVEVSEGQRQADRTGLNLRADKFEELPRVGMILGHRGGPREVDPLVLIEENDFGPLRRPVRGRVRHALTVTTKTASPAYS